MKKIAKQHKMITDDSLAISCHSLLKKNNGLFVSDRQARFFESRLRSGLYENDYASIVDLQATDFGLIYSTQKQSGSLSSRWVFTIDKDGVRQKYTQWWKLVRGKSKEEIDRIYHNMTEKQQEQVYGDLLDEAKDRWEFGGTKKLWERPSTMVSASKIAKEILSNYVKIAAEIITFQGLPTQVSIKKSEHSKTVYDVLLKNKNGKWIIRDAITMEQGYYQNQPGGGWAANVLGAGTSQGDLGNSTKPFLYGRKLDYIKEFVENPSKNSEFQLEKL